MKLSAEIHPEKSPLSKKENEILQLFAEGNSRKAIADFLFRTKGTVDTHFNHMLQKFNADSSHSMLSIAFAKGIVSFKKFAIFGLVVSLGFTAITPDSVYAADIIDSDDSPDRQPLSKSRWQTNISRRIKAKLRLDVSSGSWGVDIEA